MKHRWPLRALGVAAITVGVAGCGSLGNQDASVQGVGKQELEIGTVLPLTGGASVAGQGVKAGLQAAVGEVNAAGGIDGRKVSLRILDDHFDAATHVSDFKRLVYNDKVFAVLVPSGSANVPGDWPIVKATGIPVFGPYLPADPHMKSVFLLGTGHRDQAEILAGYLADKGAKTVAYIGQDTDIGTSLLDGLKAAAPKHHLKIVATESVQPNSTNMSSAVLNAKSAHPDALLLGTDNTQSALILKQAAQLGWKPLVAGDSSTAGTNSAATTDAAGKAASGLLGSYFATPPSADSPAVQAWHEAMLKYASDGKRFAEDSFALQSYAFAKVFFHILDEMGDDLTWDSFITHAQDLRDYQTGLLPPVSFGALPNGHTGTTGAKVAQVSDGAWQTVTPNWLAP